jgi:peptide deformylase
MAKKINLIPSMDWLISENDPVLRASNQIVKIPLSIEDEEIMLKMIKYVETSQIKPKFKLSQLLLTPAIGIAAPQIGYNKTMFFVLVPKPNSLEKIRYGLINPHIIKVSDQKIALKTGERCLSVKSHKIIHEGYVIRNYKIEIQAYEYFSKEIIKIKASGLLAIVLQHEFDHLKGKLFYERIDINNPWKRKPNLILIKK